MAKKYFFIVLGVLFLTSACLTTDPTPSVCDSNTEPSYLCEIADKFNTSLEDIGKVLIVANAVTIGSGAYSPGEAIVVLKGLRLALKNPVSYLFFNSLVREQLHLNPALFTVSETYLSEFKSPQIMHPFDREMLIRWLDVRIQAMEDLKTWPI